MREAMMRAALSQAPAPPQDLRVASIARPRPKPGEILIAIKACGVNFLDTLVVQDLYQARPQRPFAPGVEVSGVVAELGEGVSGFAPGDRIVVGMLIGFGGMAEYCVAPAGRCAPIPPGMSFEEAASFYLAYGTSHHALTERTRIVPGESLVVLGAGGGTGLAAVQIGAHLGARVIAAASSQDKIDLALGHGASKGLLYDRGPLDSEARKSFSRRIKDACGGDGADIVYDAIGGDYAEPALRAMAWKGRFLVIGFTAGIPSIPLNLPLLKGCSIIGVFYGASLERDPAQAQVELKALTALYEQGVRPFISHTFPLERAGEALACVAERRALGKVVVTI